MGTRESKSPYDMNVKEIALNRDKVGMSRPDSVRR